MSVAIKAQGIGKAYQLGEFSTGTITQDIERWWALLRGKEDPFLKLGETNDRSKKGESNIVWSLRDIDFEINQGDAVGIIGRNGAGKSTLLKVLSRVTTPTIGSIKIKGRIASLLEVGTGFHPELTGKENIFLNGAILGMRKHEIKRKFDEIVDFAGVERYIDTPVKRYSSGMYVRLAFAVAAHLESEILVVDEVLAVGDAEFQQKCIGKMDTVSKNEGRCVLFVSHNMTSITNLCQKGIFLKNGKLEFSGTSQEAVKLYNNQVSSKFELASDKKNIQKPTITKIDIDNEALVANKLKLKVFFESPFEVQTPIVGIVIYDLYGTPVMGSNARYHNRGFVDKKINSGYSELTMDELPLHSGTYRISVWLGDMYTDYDFRESAIAFEFVSTKIFGRVSPSSIIGSTNIEGFWKIYSDES